MDCVIEHLTAWAKGRPDVRALILTSSRAAPHARTDGFSDYDVILSVIDVMPFFNDKSWLSDVGPLLVVYHDPLRMYQGSGCFREITQYENGLKIDFNLWPTEVLPRVVAEPELPEELDVGYSVLLDKDGVTDGLKPPTYQAHIPKPPREEAYLTLIEDFFQEGTYVVKHLWRDDLMAAKYNLDHVMKLLNLCPMLVWRFELDHDWSIKPGAYGRGLKQQVSPALWARLESTYAGARLEDNWDALFRTIALFRDVAVEVGNRLGYAYPSDMDSRCMHYFERVRRLDRGTIDVAAALGAREETGR